MNIKMKQLGVSRLLDKLAPQRLLPSKKEILVSIPLPNPLPPELGHPPCKE